MKRLGIVAVGLALVLSVPVMACEDDSQDKDRAFDRGYLAGHSAGLSDDQNTGYQQGYREGAKDGKSDVDSVYVAVVSRRLDPYYVAWCDVALYCRKRDKAEIQYSDAFEAVYDRPYTSIPTVDVDAFKDVDAAYDAGFDKGYEDGEVIGRSLAEFKGYSDGYEDTTCASPLAQLFGLPCRGR